MAIDAPIFVVGAPRSGTTVVYKALCLHPHAAYISNWVGRYPDLPQLAALNRLAPLLPGLQQVVWFTENSGNAYVYGSPRPWWKRAFPMPVEGEPIYERCGLAEGAHGSDQRAPDRALDKLRTAFATIARFGGGKRIVSKRIANNRRIPLLFAAFPDARFVEIVRDGRSVAYSLSRVDWWAESELWWYGGIRPREAPDNPWELCARSWVEEVAALEQGLSTVPAGQLVRVTYERFVEEPTSTLREIATFVRLDPKVEWMDRLGRLQYPHPGDGWRRLCREDIAIIERVQSDTLHRFGYAT